MADNLTHTAAVIDASINQITATIPGLSEAPYLGISPDGNTLFRSLQSLPSAKPTRYNLHGRPSADENP